MFDFDDLEHDKNILPDEQEARISPNGIAGAECQHNSEDCIPDLASLLADLDRSESEDPSIIPRLSKYSIESSSLRNPDYAPALLESLENLHLLTASKLRIEYEQRGFFARDDLTSRAELVPLVREVLIWEQLTSSCLEEICRKRNVVVETGQTHRDLMRALAKPTWKFAGVPVERFSSSDVAHNVWRQVQEFKFASFENLAAQCRLRGLPFANKTQATLVAQLTQTKIWESLPVSELQKDCEKCKLFQELDDDIANRELLLRCLVLSVWGIEWFDVFKGISNLTEAEVLTDHLNNLQNSSIESLQLEFSKLSVPFDSKLDRIALVARLTQVIRWNHLPLDVLRRECEGSVPSGIGSDDLSTRETESKEREYFIRHLIIQNWKTTWESRGITISRFDKLDAISVLVSELDRIQGMGYSCLRIEFQKLKVPYDSHLELNELRGRLHNFLHWKHWPLSELERECASHGLSCDIEDDLEGVDREAVAENAIEPSNAMADGIATSCNDEFHRIDDIPNLSDLLADLDGDDKGTEEDEVHNESNICLYRQTLTQRLILKLWQSTWQDYGIPADRLGCLERVSTVVALVEHLRSMSIPDLKRNFQEKGLVFDGQMEKETIIGRLRDYLVWEYLPLDELHVECISQGITFNGSVGRYCMIQALTEKGCMKDWELRGLPVHQLGSFETVAHLVDELNHIEQMSIASLMAWYKRAGFVEEVALKRHELAKLMKSAIVWQALPINVLWEKCVELGLFENEIEQDKCSRECLVNRLLMNERILAWEEKGVPAKRISSPEVVAKLMQSHENVDKMSTPEIQAWFDNLGFKWNKCLRRYDLVQLYKKIVVWHALPSFELEKECLDGGATTNECSRESMIEILVKDYMLNFWETQGYPANRLGNIDVVAYVVERFEQIEQMNIVRLKDFYKSTNLPLEYGLDRKEMIRILKNITLWDCLTLDDLREECSKRGVTPPVIGEEARDCIEEKRNQLLAVLLSHERMDAWESNGFQVHRIGHEKVIHVVQRYEDFQRMSEKDLRKTYSDCSLPDAPRMDKNHLLEIFKRVLIWESLPLLALIEDCLKNNLPTDFENSESGDEEKRLELIARLRAHMGVEMNRSLYEDKGIPVEKVGSLQAARLVQEFESIDKMCLEDLRSWYLQTGFPDEEDLQHGELRDVLKRVMVWNALPLSDLKAECAAKDLCVEGDGKDRDRLFGLLLIFERMSAWEEKGIEARRIKDPDKAFGVAVQSSNFRKMGDDELRQLCIRSGIMPLTANSMNKEALLIALRTILTWEVMPLLELRNDCQKLKLPVQEGGQDERTESMRWLVAATWCNNWTERGIPGERLENLDVVHSLVQEFDRVQTGILYHDMFETTSDFLRSEYKQYDLPFDRDLNVDDLVRRLKDVLVWLHLPAQELTKDYRNLGMIAKSTLPPSRQDMLKHLILETWSSTWTSRGIPAKRIGDLQTMCKLVDDIDEVRFMSVLHLKTQCRKKGIRFDPYMDKEALWQRLRDVIVWEHLPANELQRECLSYGVASSTANHWAKAQSYVKQNQTPLGQSYFNQKLGQTPFAKSNAKSIAGKANLGSVSPFAKRQSFQTSSSFKPHDPPKPLLKAHEKAAVERNPVVDKLLDQACLLQWEREGIPIKSLGDVQMGIKLIEGVDQLDAGAIKSWYACLGLPEETDLKQSEIARLMKMFKIWEALSLEGLRKEGARLGLAVGEDTKNTKDTLLRKLLVQERFEAWEKKGFQVRRIGDTDRAIQMVAEQTRIDRMSLKELMEWYKQTNLPDGGDLQKVELIEACKKLHFWKVLPLEELKVECRQNKLTIDDAVLSGTNDDQSNQLVLKLLLNDRMNAWEGKGLNVRRFGDPLVASRALTRMEEFQRMSTDELKKTYTSLFPVSDVEIDRSRIIEILKLVLTWELLPLSELEIECVKHKITASIEVDDDVDGDAKRDALCNQLRMSMWIKMNQNDYEKKGIPVGRLDSEKVLGAAAQIDHYNSLDIQELESLYCTLGFRKQVVSEKPELIRFLSSCLIWELLPLAELHKECLDLSLPIDLGCASSTDEEEKRQILQVRLRTDMYVKCQKSDFESRGIPLDRLGTIQALKAAEELDRLDAMTEKELRIEYNQRHMPSPWSANIQDVMSRLRQASLWEVSSVSELFVECRKRGMNTNGFSKVSGEEQKKKIILDMLLLDLCMREFDKLDVPTISLSSCKAATKIANEWASLAMLQEPDIVKRYTQAGLSAQYLQCYEMRDRLKKMAWWKELPFDEILQKCRSKGVSASPSDSQTMLIHRLSKALWPPKENPKPPPPRPPPPPQPPKNTMSSTYFKMAQHYRALGLPPSAGLDDVKKAFRKLALIHHPDKNQGAGQARAAQEFRKIAEAYETLSNHLQKRIP